MKIAYCTNVRLPSERAHGHQIAQVCDALARLGHTVTVFCPYRKNIIKEDFWTYYGVSRKIRIQYVGKFDPIDRRWIPKILQLPILNRRMRRNLRKVFSLSQGERVRERGSFDLLYTRSSALLSTLLRTNIPVALELHQLPRRGKRKFVQQCNYCKVIACLTSAMRDALQKRGVDRKKLMVAGDAVDLRRFRKLPAKARARAMFGVKTDRPVVGYVGRLKTLGMEKGVGVLLQAAASMKQGPQPRRAAAEKKTIQQPHPFVGAASQVPKFFTFIVGGPDRDRQEYEVMARKFKLGKHDVRFTGEIPSTDVPAALAACDILAMPFPDIPHYRQHMSPLKMFEYMAAERPIITSDLPTVRDVLANRDAVFCAPGDVQSFLEAFAWIQGHPKGAAAKVKHARAKAENHTWEKRMEKILESTQ